MGLYKYFSAEGAQRFLSTWSLRFTPPDEFNDPFEMSPPVEIVSEEEIFSANSIEVEFIRFIQRDFAPVCASDPQFPETLTRCLLGRLTNKKERRFLSKYPPIASQIPMMRNQLKSALAQARQNFPEAQKRFKAAIHRSVRTTIGALCMSRNGRHPLMWAHYAEEHRGLVIEFDSSAACFKRKRSPTDELGTFRRVNYELERPILDRDAGEDWFVRLSLTKAKVWEYEEEERFLWLLSCADRIAGNSVHLLNIPPAAVSSIILGCRANETLIDTVWKLFVAITDCTTFPCSKRASTLAGMTSSMRDLRR